MKNNKKILIVISLILIITVSIVIIWKYNNPKLQKYEDENGDIELERINKTAEEVEHDYINAKENSVMYKANSTIDQLKEEYKMTGNNELYQIETEYDGRKVLNIKPSIKYKAAFAGMIKKTRPSFDELDKIFEQNHPNKNGIWINTENREKIQNYLNTNNKLKASYEVNEEGYLKQNKTSKQSSIDTLIGNLIDGDKQYIVSISSACYTVDAVTGDIIENRYNDLESYQTYEYFEDENKMILFISENKENELTDEEIFQSIIELLK